MNEQENATSWSNVFTTCQFFWCASNRVQEKSYSCKYQLLRLQEQQQPQYYKQHLHEPQQLRESDKYNINSQHIYHYDQQQKLTSEKEWQHLNDVEHYFEVDRQHKQHHMNKKNCIEVERTKNKQQYIDDEQHCFEIDKQCNLETQQWIESTQRIYRYEQQNYNEQKNQYDLRKNHEASYHQKCYNRQHRALNKQPQIYREKHRHFQLFPHLKHKAALKQHILLPKKTLFVPGNIDTTTTTATTPVPTTSSSPTSSNRSNKNKTSPKRPTHRQPTLAKISLNKVNNAGQHEQQQVSSPSKVFSPTISLSPDQSLEDLLSRQNSEEEASRMYLKIKAKYITDGQGVVTGILLVTPQTLMFNPSVSDCLVMDRGRDYYVIRLPLRALAMVVLFKDIAAMVTGDHSQKYTPSNLYEQFSPPRPGLIVREGTGEEYCVSSVSKDNENNASDDLDKVKEQLGSLSIADLTSGRLNNIGEGTAFSNQKHGSENAIKRFSTSGNKSNSDAITGNDNPAGQDNSSDSSLTNIDNSSGTMTSLDSCNSQSNSANTTLTGTENTGKSFRPTNLTDPNEQDNNTNIDGYESVRNCTNSYHKINDVEHTGNCSFHQEGKIQKLKCDDACVQDVTSGLKEVHQCISELPPENDVLPNSTKSPALCDDSESNLSPIHSIKPHVKSISNSIESPSPNNESEISHTTLDATRDPVFFDSEHNHLSSTPEHEKLCGDKMSTQCECKTLDNENIDENSSQIVLSKEKTQTHKRQLNLNLKSPPSLAAPNISSEKNSEVKSDGGTQKMRNAPPRAFDSSRDSGFSDMTTSRSLQSVEECDFLGQNTTVHKKENVTTSLAASSSTSEIISPTSTLSSMTSAVTSATSSNTSSSTAITSGGSHLSKEAKKWLGKHAVSPTNFPSRPFTVPSPLSPNTEHPMSPDIEPRPSEQFVDPLMYVAVSVHNNFWCPKLTSQNAIMGIPPNRDQKRRQYWLAIPRERVDQFYSFIVHWLPDIQSRVSTPSTEDIHEEHEGLNIVEDAFGSDYSPATTYGWEKLNGDDAASMHKLRVGSVASSKSSLRSFGDDEPEMSSESSLLTKEQLRHLSRKLPSTTVGRYMDLIYSTGVHGISLNTLYRNFTSFDCPVLLIITDDQKRVFGAFLSDPPMVSEGFYGTGECMLFTFKKEKTPDVYKWSGENNFFIKGSKSSLSIGGGEGVLALWIDEDLYHGRSHSCSTFDNETLSATEDFICRNVEAWGFI